MLCFIWFVVLGGRLVSSEGLLGGRRTARVSFCHDLDGIAILESAPCRIVDIVVVFGTLLALGVTVAAARTALREG